MLDYRTLKPQSQRSILVASKDPGMRMLMTRLLNARNCTILEASTAEEAAKAVASNEHLDLAFSDIDSAEDKGIGILEQFKNYQPNTPVVFLSGNYEVDEYLSAMDEGAFDYLAKPVQVGDLFRVIDRAFSEEELGRQLEFATI